ncbi:hypothetical protein CTI12_AA078740 [Artemisia annua]|uniref:DUF4283 domain-containing protein n=1 Tax=Artemisia annua TaxID=35608 RepID=A0A2U1Q3W9_ARTAN|nr:hypothetical protein CTI12_AA078740 [Artemisia annua]
MPMENNKPPEPLVEEFCELTGLSPDKVRLSKSGIALPKMKEGKARRHRHGIKIRVSSPGSASVGAGSILRNLRSSMVFGKSIKRNESSPMDSRGGKHVINSLNSDDDISKVSSSNKSGPIDSKLKFEMGSSTVNKPVDSNVKALGKSVADTINIVNGNDGSFINQPIDVSPILNKQSSPVAKNCDLETSSDNPSAGGVDSGSSVRNEHTSMEGVVNVGDAPSNSLDGIACNKESMDFEFGRNDRGNGILKKPNIPVLNVQFGTNVLGNPFITKAASTNKIGNWSAGFGNAFGSTILSNQYSAVADRFAEKLKKGTEEMALKMEYTPGFVSVQENGNRRIEFTAEEVYKGGQACRPMIMDKMTKERCLKKAGKMDFARVLVEILAEEDLPNVLEIAYPPLGNRPARVGKLEVKYQWKPPLCTFCKTFGHTTMSCKSRPRKVEEMAANVVKESAVMNESVVAKGKTIAVDGEGFSVVGKKNKPLVNSSSVAPTKPGYDRNTSGGNNFSSKQSVQNKNTYSNDRNNVASQRQNNFKFGDYSAGPLKINKFQSNGNDKHGKGQYKAKSNLGGNHSPGSGQNPQMKNVTTADSSSAHDSVAKAHNAGNGRKSLRQLSQDPNFKPKVLTRGSNSNSSPSSRNNENIPLSNTFSVLINEEMLEEVDVLMEAGIYPSKAVRLDWTLHQMDYFYKNCHKYMLDPISKDDEDVESKTDGVAGNMKPEYVVDAADVMGNSAAPNVNVLNGV